MDYSILTINLHITPLKIGKKLWYSGKSSFFQTHSPHEEHSLLFSLILFGCDNDTDVSISLEPSGDPPEKITTLVPLSNISVADGDMLVFETWDDFQATLDQLHSSRERLVTEEGILDWEARIGIKSLRTSLLETIQGVRDDAITPNSDHDGMFTFACCPWDCSDRDFFGF